MKLRIARISATLAFAFVALSSAPATAATEVASSASDAVSFTSPGPLTRVDERNPEFSGTGKAGASVVVTDPEGTVLCAARVTAEGWSCRSVVDMGDGPTAAFAVQDAWAVKTADDVAFTVTNVDEPAVPLWVFAIGAAVLGLVGAASIAIAVVIRRRMRRRGSAHRGAFVHSVSLPGAELIHPTVTVREAVACAKPSRNAQVSAAPRSTRKEPSCSP